MPGKWHFKFLCSIPMPKNLHNNFQASSKKTLKVWKVNSFTELFFKCGITFTTIRTYFEIY